MSSVQTKSQTGRLWFFWSAMSPTRSVWLMYPSSLQKAIPPPWSCMQAWAQRPPTATQRSLKGGGATAWPLLNWKTPSS